MERLLGDDVLEKITQIQNKEITDDLDLLDVHAFLDGVTLYHGPQHYSHLLSFDYIQSNLEPISRIAGSDKIQACGGLSCVAYIAAQEGHASVLSELAKHDVNFNIPFITTALSLRSFAEKHDESIKNRIEQFIADAQYGANLLISPKQIAYLMGHTDIVAFLSEKESIEHAPASMRSTTTSKKNSFFKGTKLNTITKKRDEKEDDLDNKPRKNKRLI